MAVSFAKGVRPLFRDDPDVEAMKGYHLDLSSDEAVKARADAICRTLADGSMPCDSPWPTEQVARFKQWIDEGTIGKAAPVVTLLD